MKATSTERLLLQKISNQNDIIIEDNRLIKLTLFGDNTAEIEGLVKGFRRHQKVVDLYKLDRVRVMSFSSGIAIVISVIYKLIFK